MFKFVSMLKGPLANLSCKGGVSSAQINPVYVYHFMCALISIEMNCFVGFVDVSTPASPLQTE